VGAALRQVRGAAQEREQAPCWRPRAASSSRQRRGWRREQVRGRAGAGRRWRAAAAAGGPVPGGSAVGDAGSAGARWNGSARARARGHEQALAQGGTAGSAGARSGGAQASERGRRRGAGAQVEQ
jgi:hypothetical protein